LPLSNVLTAYNKVRAQGAATLLLGVVNVALASAIAHSGVGGAIGVAASTAFALTIRNLVFLSTYSARVMRLPGTTFYAPLTGGALGTLGVGLGSFALTRWYWPQGWIELCAMGLGVAALYGIVIYPLALNSADRTLLWSLLRLRSNVARSPA
jgi:hypothetical protein